MFFKVKIYLFFQVLKVNGHFYAHTHIFPVSEAFPQFSVLKVSLWCCMWKGCSRPLAHLSGFHRVSPHQLGTDPAG